MPGSLFLLKFREDYSADPSYSGSYQIATGMWNSAKFVVDALNAAGSEARVELCIDANSIDAVTVEVDPLTIFIEGLWVTPAKFAELMALPRHAGRRWVVRIHSAIPFLASEGVAMDWISQYLQMGVVVAPNDPRAHSEIKLLAENLGLTAPQIQDRVPYLPNCYPTVFETIPPLNTSTNTHLDVGCFGAFRPLKNNLQQVFVAKRFADHLGLPLRFHTNSRMDFGGEGPARNVNDALESLGAVHVRHGWEDRETFLQSLRDIDVLLQLSMSETFNIVAADCTLVGKPLLASNEIPWSYPLYGDPNDVNDCVQKLKVIWANKSFFVQGNRRGLTSYARQSISTWLRFVA